MNNNKKRKIIILLVVILVIIGIGCILFLQQKNLFPTKVIKIEVKSIDELNQKIDVNVNIPVAAYDVEGSVINDKVANINYKKIVSDGKEMNFTLRSSSSTEENNLDIKNKWGETPILMTVICKDESDVEVEAYVAYDDRNVMKAEWYDNDKYWLMFTDNLVSREDFLQEVNKIIIANHIEF